MYGPVWIYRDAKKVQLLLPDVVMIRLSGYFLDLFQQENKKGILFEQETFVFLIRRICSVLKRSDFGQWRHCTSHAKEMRKTSLLLHGESKVKMFYF